MYNYLHTMYICLYIFLSFKCFLSFVVVYFLKEHSQGGVERNGDDDVGKLIIISTAIV